MKQTSPRVGVPAIKLPKGGGAIKGIGETFQPSPFTGVANFEIPIETPSARGLSPDLSLSYSSGGSQGPFGMGFTVSIPQVTRRTEKRLPDYSAEDEFVLSESEYLIPALKQQSESTWVAERSQSADRVYQIYRYRPRTEGSFLRIEQWVRHGDGDTHWQMTTPDNVTNIYGRSANARISHPHHPHQVFSWLLEETADDKGNQIRYHYKSEDSAGSQNSLSEAGRDQTTQKYLHKIQYGSYIDPQQQPNTEKQQKWAFSVVFDYGEYDLDHLETLTSIPAANRAWKKRLDSFSDYRAGFEIRTHRLCRNILVFHHFPQALGGSDCLVRALQLEYDESPVLSFLRRVQVTGLRRQGSGEYERRAMPPLTFRYSQADPSAQTFQPLLDAQQAELPLTFDEAGYQFLDLYGEGISGILYDQQGTTLYWSPAGQAVYTLPHPVAAFPNERNDPTPSYSLSDGISTWMTVRTNERSGYYQLQSEDSWQGFQPFAGTPVEIEHPAAEFTDVTGDGRPDLLIFERDRVKVYPSAGSGGHRTAMTALREHAPPLSRSIREKIQLADMGGDGLSDRVRVSNGNVTYWPNLGYGRFGEPVVMENAPHFGSGLEDARIFLVDIDGSGTSDLVYADANHVLVYLNQSGNRFSDPIEIRLPAGYDRTSQIQFADVLGNGTACLVLSTGTQPRRHQFYDFTGGVKPHLLTEIDNHTGAITRVRYAPSSDFYLADKQRGQPWLTRLPFPVQLVEKIETLDQISQSKQVSRFAYHHGAFDAQEREFAGFGLVERWDSEAFEQFAADDLLTEHAFELLDSDLHVPPAYTKTWYHTGVVEREGVLSRQFEAEYYAGDDQALDLQDSLFEAGSTADPNSLREAYRALRGRVLREEVYTAPPPGDRLLLPHKDSRVPFMAKESAYLLRLVQPKTADRYSIYLPLLREEITYQYEQDATDPRIQHTFQLEYDAYGKPTRQASIVYPRRRADLAHPDQRRLQGRYTYRCYIHLTEKVYRLGVLATAQTFELGGLSPDRGGYYSWGQVAADYAEPEKTAVDFHEPIPGQGARLLTWEDYFYWDNPQTDALPMGQTGDRGLLHHVETAMHTQVGLEQALAGSSATGVTQILLDRMAADGGAFRLKRRPGWAQYYIDPGTTAVYGSAVQFFQPQRFVDQFGGETQITYDDYALAIAKTAEKVDDTQWLERRVTLDYLTLSPQASIDVNGNLTLYSYDPLGSVRYLSRQGQEGGHRRGDPAPPAGPLSETTDLAAILSDPHAYLQQSTGFYYYEPAAWETHRQPGYAVSLNRASYTSDLGDNERSQIQIQIEYADGLGRRLQSKQKAEPGLALQIESDGRVTQRPSEDRWLTSGRVVYDNKGHIVKQYEPFYDRGPVYQSEKDLTTYGVATVQRHDPLGRLIQVDLPKGFRRRTEYGAWGSREWDANDAILEAPYNDRLSSLGADDRAALEQARRHANTPVEIGLDSWGRPFLTQTRAAAAAPPLSTYTRLDIAGNPIASQDPRLGRSGAVNFKMAYDMAGRVIAQTGVDSGQRWMLYNAGGDEIHRWDGRGFRQSRHYDLLSRLTAVWVLGNGLDHQVEAIEYGDSIDPQGENNLRGQVLTHADEAGVVRFERYSIEGDWQTRHRQLRRDYRTVVNWQRSPALESERLSERRTLNALQQVVAWSQPSGQQLRYDYYPSGRLESVRLQTGNQTQIFAEAIRYNALGQREAITYGNQVETTFAYDPETFNLVELKTVRRRDRRELQGMQYTYDPVGNVVRIRDRTHQTLFANGQAIAPQLAYTYDALYRLTEARGREHPGLYATRPQASRPDYERAFTVQPNVNNLQGLQNYHRLYQYDDANNLIRVEHRANGRGFTRQTPVEATSNRLQADGRGNRPGYDTNGNLIQADHLDNLTWNYRNQLTAAAVIRRDNGVNDQEYYVYDAAGRRVRKVSQRLVNGKTEITETIYLDTYEIKRISLGDKLMEERHSLHVTDLAEKIATIHEWTVQRETQATNRQVRYQLGNHQGSVSLELDANGNLITYEEYYPYGGTALIAAASQREVKRKQYRYSGRERDGVTQLYYYGARYYAPWLGRWLSPDPAGTVDGLNLYQFVQNNPVSHLDDGGLLTKKLWQRLRQYAQRQFVSAAAATAQANQPRPPSTANAARPTPGRRALTQARRGGSTANAARPAGRRALTQARRGGTRQAANQPANQPASGGAPGGPQPGANPNNNAAQARPQPAPKMPIFDQSTLMPAGFSMDDKKKFTAIVGATLFAIKLLQRPGKLEELFELKEPGKGKARLRQLLDQYAPDELNDDYRKRLDRLVAAEAVDDDDSDLGLGDLFGDSSAASPANSPADDSDDESDSDESDSRQSHSEDDSSSDDRANRPQRPPSRKRN